MLGILQHIVQQVNEAPNLHDALVIIVHRVKEAMAVDACSVYLKNATADRYVLMASDGLHPESVGRVGVSPKEGLIGLVAASQELVNLENATDHPAYRFVPETGEERYHGFLGVPLVHFRSWACCASSGAHDGPSPGMRWPFSSHLRPSLRTP